MASEVSIFSADIPAHILERQAQFKQNVENVSTVPTLGITGKVFSISIGGKTKELTEVDSEGERTPIQVLGVVILDYATRRGRTYYEGTYEKDKPGHPVCWSNDGITPHSSVKEENKQSDKCALCPKSAKGSRISDSGKAMVACSEHRMLAVVPEIRLDAPPLRLKIPVTSDWDTATENSQGDWMAFQQFKRLLQSRNMPTMNAFVTKLKFASGEAYPKLLFKGGRYLNATEADLIIEKANSDETAAIISGEFSPEGADGRPVASLQDDSAPTVELPKKKDFMELDEAPKEKPASRGRPKKEAEVKEVKAEKVIAEPIEAEISDELAAILGGL